jgi:hypothetical protein
VICFSQANRSWHLVAREPSWFLHLTWSGDAMHGLGVWRCRSFASSCGFSCKVFSSISPRFYFKKHTFCFLPLVTIFKIFIN